MELKAPFPYFGGKSAIAGKVWDRFGDVPNYVEPFAGSAAVLLARPHWPWEGNRVETINDADCFLANFWRALRSEPNAVAEHCDWPVNEADLHARHLWLVNVGREHVEKLRTDPDYYDAKIAGWWVWGCCQWIGSGWCRHPEWQQLPHLGDAGRGMHRPSQRRPHLGPGTGVHRPSVGDLRKYLSLLADRLRRVRVCCGDWSRVCGGKTGNALSTMLLGGGNCAVFLDPPYTDKANRKNNIYAIDDTDIGHEVRDWAVEHGDDDRMRIALCGYEGEYDMPDSWTCVEWKANGSFSSLYGASGKGRANSRKERIWFSPHCISRTNRKLGSLF